MGLRTAGLISGLGQGLGQGLSQLQSGIIQQGLFQSRFEQESARAAAATTADQAFQMKKMELQQQHETKLQQDTQTHTAGQNQQKMGADIALHAGDRAAAAEQTSRKIASDEALKDKELGIDRDKMGVQNTQKNRELSATEQHNKDWANVYGQRAGSTKAAQLPPELKAKIEVLEKQSERHARSKNTALALAAKEVDEVAKETYLSQAEAAREEQDAVDKTLEGLVGVSVTRKKVGGAGAVKDRFGKSPLLSKGQ